jgi:hypothetical protein
MRMRLGVYSERERPNGRSRGVHARVEPPVPHSEHAELALRGLHVAPTQQRMKHPALVAQSGHDFWQSRTTTCPAEVAQDEQDAMSLTFDRALCV